jgi:tRNA A22 N-methylase
MKLSPRLHAIFKELTPGQPVADICCDHGHLGAHAYLSGQFPEIIFVDQVVESMKQLESKFNQYCRNSENPTRVEFITVDAKKLRSSLTGNVVIAGVGGLNMMEMLEGLFTSPSFKPRKLVLSPHRNDELYERAELFGLKHSHTSTVIEDGRTRSIFVFSV